MIEIEEVGELFEYLQYGRNIEEINMNEVIYINDISNSTKTLDEFKNGFNDLKNMALKEVVIKASENNNEIKEVLKIYNSLTEEDFGKYNIKIRKKIQKYYF